MEKKDKISTIKVHESTKRLIEQVMFARESYEQCIVRVFEEVTGEAVTGELID